jgi:septal ring factor EnvC (AmiA/AmiB activator)
MESRKEYIDKFARQLKQWDSDIQVMQEKIKNYASNTKIDLQKQLNNLESQRNILKIKLDKMKDGSDEIWKDLREGTEKGWAELKDRISSISSKIN